MVQNEYKLYMDSITIVPLCDHSFIVCTKFPTQAHTQDKVTALLHKCMTLLMQDNELTTHASTVAAIFMLGVLFLNNHCYKL